MHQYGFAERWSATCFLLQVDGRGHVHERQWNELGETAGFFLQIARDHDVSRPRLWVFDTAVHDRDV